MDGHLYQFTSSIRNLDSAYGCLGRRVTTTFASGAGNALDDLVFLKLDGDTLETETYAYNAANELTSQVINGTTLTYTYDQFGRMTRKTGGGKTADYYYHYGDKLTKVASNFGGEGTVTYTYGGDQKRRSRAVTGGDTTKYRYGAGWDVLNEEDGSGTLQATYVHHPGKQIGTVLATSEGTSAATGTWNYYFQDAIGSTQSKIRRRRNCGIRTATASVNTNIRLRRTDGTPSAGNTPTRAKTSRENSPATTGIARPGCIILPTGTTAPTPTAGSPGIPWAWSMARMFMRMW